MDLIQSAISSFKEQLSSVFEDYERSKSSRPRVSMAGGIHGRSRGRNGIPPQVRFKLTQMEGLANDVLQQISSTHNGHSLTDEGTEDPSVCLIGPPGSEPRTDLPFGAVESDTCNEENESVLYHRNSNNITLTPFLSPNKLQQVQLKDSPPSMCEVIVEPPKEWTGIMRYTRSRERAYFGDRMPVCYREESSEESDVSSEEDDHFSPTVEENDKGSVSTARNSVPARHPVVRHQLDFSVYSTPSSSTPQRDKESEVLNTGCLSVNDSHIDDKDIFSETATMPAELPSNPDQDLVQESTDHKDNKLTINSPGQNDSSIDDLLEASMSTDSPDDKPNDVDPLSDDSPNSSREHSMMCDTMNDTLAYETAHKFLVEPKQQGNEPEDSEQDERPQPPKEHISSQDKKTTVKADKTAAMESTATVKEQHVSERLRPKLPKMLFQEESSRHRAKPNKTDTPLSGGSEMEVESPEVSGIARVLEDLQESFGTKKVAKKVSKRNVSITKPIVLRSSTRMKKCTPKPELEVQPAPERLPTAEPDVPSPPEATLKRTPVLCIKKLLVSDEKLKQLLSQKLESDRAGPSPSGSEASKSWAEFEEEVRASTSPSNDTAFQLPDSPSIEFKSPQLMTDSYSDIENQPPSPRILVSIHVDANKPRDYSTERSSHSSEPLEPLVETPMKNSRIKLRGIVERSSLANSDDDFDMTTSQPPPFSRFTPSQKAPSGVSTSVKKKKRLRSLLDDEDEVFSFPTVKLESSKVKEEESLASKIDEEDPLGSTAKNDDSSRVALNSDEDGIKLGGEAANLHEEDTEHEDLDGGIESGATDGLCKNSRESPSKGNNSLIKRSESPVNKSSSKKSVEGPKDERYKLPNKIPCIACGRLVVWRKALLHKHPILDVLVCHSCLGMITCGEYTSSDGHEEYCRVCGDGGDILMCESCPKSICQQCIERISGKDSLEHLLQNEDEEFTCYCCDPLPLGPFKRDFEELQLRRTRTDVQKGARGKKHKAPAPKSQEFVDDSEEDNATVKSEPSSIKSSTSKTDKDTGNSTPDPASSAEHKKKQLSLSSRRKGSVIESSPASMSEFMSDSPEVNTDEISLSDSSVFGHNSKEKKKVKKMKRGRVSGNNSNADEQGAKANKAREKSGKNNLSKKRRLIQPVLRGSDFECESVSSSASLKAPVQKHSKKRLFSSSSSTEEVLQSSSRAKRSRLAERLSSDSECENENLLTVEMSQNVSEDRSLLPSTPPPVEIPYKPLTYLTPTTRFLISSDSSDTETTQTSQKPKKRRRVRRFSSNSQSEDSSTETGLRAAKKALGQCSDDDFTDLSRMGPRLKKKSVRKLVLSESDSDGPSKEAKNDSEEEGKSPEKQSTPRKKRKDIRKMIDDSKLDAKTKLAVRMENERKERLKKKGSGSHVSEDEQLVLEPDSNSKQPKVMVRQSLTKHIKPHQKEGIKFLYDSCVESLDRFKAGERNGAILAHCMGLGKTLQLLAFIDALLCVEESEVKRVIILTPVNTLYNWVNEIERWIPKRDYGVYVMNITGIQQRLKRLKSWFRHGGILFMGYSMFRILAMGKRMRRKNTKEELAQCLLDPGADIMVCDEGHVMRNSKSSLSIILGQVKTLCRVVLTGTPLQNNLMEYFTMINFVKPNLLGTQKEFRNRFVNPIKNGQCSDSLPSDIREMKRRAHVLHKMVEDCVQRKDYRVLAAALPPKQEYVIAFRLSEVQDKLYRYYLEKFRVYGAKDLFSTFSNLAKVWNHPWVLKLSEERANEREERRAWLLDDDEEDSSLDGFIVSGSEDEVEVKEKGKRKKPSRRRGSSTTSSSRSSREPFPSRSNSIDPIVINSDSDFELPSLETLTTVKSEVVVKAEQGAPSNLIDLLTDTVVPQAVPNGVGEKSANHSMASNKHMNWYDELLTDDIETKIEASGKLMFLVELLRHADTRREKVIVFSQSLLTLNLIESFLCEAEHGDWTPGIDYYRLDGSTSADVRQANMIEFNDEKNDRMRLFLISTRAGSLGVNLVAANRVVIFDACWNPSHDLQAIFRAYRFGQTKPVFVYRLLAQGTMEEKIYDRQVTKESLSMRVVDHKQIGRHFTASDLAELFTYSPKPPASPPYNRPTNDMALCSILNKFEPKFISGYHEHDSLLEHIYDEELTEEEKKAAWESYEQQTKAESQRYNYESLQGRIEEIAQNALIGQPTVQSAAPPVPPPLQYVPQQVGAIDPFTQAVHSIRTSIQCYKNLLDNTSTKEQIMRGLSQGRVVRNVAVAQLNELAFKQQTYARECRRLLDISNQAISNFNSTPELSQNQAMNLTIREMRAQLNELHNKALTSVPSAHGAPSQVAAPGPSVNPSRAPNRDTTVSSTTN